MFSWEKTGDRVAIVQMNAELRTAQLELLSAQCATDRLRLRFSAQDIARHAQRDTLRKALSSATALHHYYKDIALQVEDPDSISASAAASWTDEKIAEAIRLMAEYLHEQREHFRRNAQPLSADHRQAMAPFFPANVLETIRIVVLKGSRVQNPPFYAEARTRGLTNLPEFTHMTSLTFEDVVVFHGDVTDRALFHALVHAIQFEVLGLARYTELFVRSFLQTRSHISVPLEAHAFALESKFAGDPERPFSVEEKVQLWVSQGRY
ncbi:MAG TPA: hypothetical protein VNW47_09630 [Terriglobales bacterium]|jgi:hypothetical protein|nr:hypothetical protein [Terriglobales bacterium]